MQDPDRYLAQQGLALACAVQPSRRALLLPAMRVHVNREIFYFANSQNRQAFLEDPTRYCGTLTDPVTEERFGVAEDSPHVTYDGRLFYFSSDSTRAAFDGKPDRYAARDAR